ncbi:MAG: RagB/SusD family nutrient uptake outer membrane protein [Prevotellaceae bacterium]|jgi:hypothetical protein|nr:RagB/SusD family nutrient uptake outer membrane protein [Prevotellaceae bacterium]
MNLRTIKYKAIAFGLATTLFASGCKDFLDRDLEDQFSTESIQTMDQYVNLTGALYGGKIWGDYIGKFSWVINEGLSGNLYNIYDQEGEFFRGNISPSNDMLKEGYTSLYSGVISAANFLINKDKSTLSEEDALKIEAEARMFRGIAYFLATEFWGEVPLVLNNEYDIVNRVKLPKADRETIYKVIETDWEFAANYLPSEMNWGPLGGRVSKWGAKGMLAKLYLTMASCQTPGLNHPYVCPDPEGYYQKAITLASEVIENSGAGLTAYAEIFGWNNMRKNSESLFALHFEDYGYAIGSPYQAQMAKDAFWGPSAAWGGGKGIAHTLLRSYKLGDARKKEVSMYYGEKFFNYRGEEAAPFGRSALQGIEVLNNIKKFVYGYESTRHEMSCNMRLDFLRLADVYMMRIEAKMALENMSVDAETSPAAWREDLRKVLAAHAGSNIANQLDSIPLMAFYKSPGTEEISYEFNGEDQDGNTANRRVSMLVPRERTDFIQERRKEFAMEGQTWLDIKRLYYRNPQAAKNFLKEQDRGWSFQAKFNIDTDNPGALETPDGYVRIELFNKLMATYPRLHDGSFSASEEGGVGGINPALKNGNFDNWFLPLPAEVVPQIASGPGQRFVEDLLNGSYPY